MASSGHHLRSTFDPEYMTRLFPMPIGEPDGRTTPRPERIVRAFRTALTCRPAPT
jgi:hypothetical protein